jgi:hypothetical protein
MAADATLNSLRPSTVKNSLGRWRREPSAGSAGTRASQGGPHWGLTTRQGYDAYHVRVPLALNRRVEGGLPIDRASPTAHQAEWTRVVKLPLLHAV